MTNPLHYRADPTGLQDYNLKGWLIAHPFTVATYGVFNQTTSQYNSNSQKHSAWIYYDMGTNEFFYRWSDEPYPSYRKLEGKKFAHPQLIKVCRGLCDDQDIARWSTPSGP